MKLYVCWGTFPAPRPPHGHPCRNAHQALLKAGYDPEVVKVQGLGIGPVKINTAGREEVARIAGTKVVPVLVTDDGEVISESHRIMEWAEAHPAPSSARAPSSA